VHGVPNPSLVGFALGTRVAGAAGEGHTSGLAGEFAPGRQRTRTVLTALAVI
jgi:hypothetical protein